MLHLGLFCNIIILDVYYQLVLSLIGRTKQLAKNLAMLKTLPAKLRINFEILIVKRKTNNLIL